jgi:hypothetical protein
VKSAHSCRLCGYWLEGDYNLAPAGPDGEAQRTQALAEMGQGHCNPPCRLAPEPRDQTTAEVYAERIYTTARELAPERGFNPHPATSAWNRLTDRFRALLVDAVAQVIGPLLVERRDLIEENERVIGGRRRLVDLLSQPRVGVAPRRCAICHVRVALGIVHGPAGYHLGWTCMCWTWDRATEDVVPTHAEAVALLHQGHLTTPPEEDHPG